MDWLDEIEARANAATPGPWSLTEAEGFCDCIGPCPFQKDVSDKECENCNDWRWSQGAFIDTALTIDCGEYDGMNDADAEFCAHAREDIPRLVAEVRKLCSGLARVTAERDELVRVLPEVCHGECSGDPGVGWPACALWEYGEPDEHGYPTRGHCKYAPPAQLHRRGSGGGGPQDEKEDKPHG